MTSTVAAHLTKAADFGSQSFIPPAFQPGFIPSAIGAAFAGGIYAGIIRSVDGGPDQHLVLVDGEGVDLSWEAAGTWAESVGGSLPTRAEQALLFANLKDQFKSDWYWSGEQAGPSCAWGQLFNVGTQHDSYRSYEGRARAVRRLPI
ncbi:hypothetical protein JAB1_46610 [Janthinobacterium sp. MP5059B]|uniref:DUF1566 domain-containing protein n=1 Tax=Janthinobacterium sp. MP5059B TaxID=1766683 RepID=UPI000893CDD3|nr:DUF1566 domain-containing protein [Janthinobacterium sp. MP5059B]OEZ46723.1 hypothetical protein JAB1_46610 [Janthinobacterium sp. MP5059B]